MLGDATEEEAAARLGRAAGPPEKARLSWVEAMAVRMAWTPRDGSAPEDDPADAFGCNDGEAAASA